MSQIHIRFRNASCVLKEKMLTPIPPFSTLAKATSRFSLRPLLLVVSSNALNLFNYIWNPPVYSPLCSLCSETTGWFSNRTGTSVDDGKARGKDQTGLPVLSLLLRHWSSRLFDFHAPSSTDVPVLLLNQPINSFLDRCAAYGASPSKNFS